eukprot:2943787-Rhodomonas_salina.1
MSAPAITRWPKTGETHRLGVLRIRWRCGRVEVVVVWPGSRRRAMSAPDIHAFAIAADDDAAGCWRIGGGTCLGWGRVARWRVSRRSLRGPLKAVVRYLRTGRC